MAESPQNRRNLTVQQAIGLAAQHFDAGDLPKSEHVIRQILRTNPRQPAALHLLGLIAHRTGNDHDAADLINKALEGNPNDAWAHCNLGIVLRELGRLDDAVSSFRRAIAANPELADAHFNLGNTLKELKKFDEAVSSYRTAAAINPRNADVHSNLGVVLTELGRFDEAEASFREAISINPRLSGAHSNLGLALGKLGQPDEAEASLRQAVAIDPDNAEAHSNLGLHLNAHGRFDEAVSRYRTALAIRPDYAEAHYNLGNALKNLYEFSASESSYRQAISIKPDYAEAHSNLGRVLQDVGRVEEAIASYRQALAVNPGFDLAHGNLLLALNYGSETTQGEIEAESAAWARRLDVDVSTPPTFDNDRNPDRPLRVGFVSPDMRTHSVSYFFEPLLHALDPAIVETVCYADVDRPDETTSRLQACAGRWRDTAGLPDSRVDEVIRADGIDILIDLAGHTRNNRLRVFANRPAPVQVTWLGYPNTTGLAAMDYRLVDAVTDPTDEGSETPIRLPRGFLCYRPPEAAPPCRPTRDEGPIRFASFNNVAKMSGACIAAWSQILSQIPDAVLVLKSPIFADEAASAHIVEAFGRHGIASHRFELLPFSGSVAEHLEMYGDIDVCLDPFPYNGTTTTCEALWMGVPVVTLLGEHHRGRVGASILTRVGLDDCIAPDVDAYVASAQALAGDASRRADLRQNMRAMMTDLCDAQAFARDMEAALRAVWHRWCRA